MNSGPSISTKPIRVNPETATSEAQLLERARVFDEAALEEIYDLYEERIFAYIYLRIGDPTLAEDLTAQVFLKMLALLSKTNWD